MDSGEMDLEEAAAIACGVFMAAVWIAVEDIIARRTTQDPLEDEPAPKKPRPNVDDDGNRRERPKYDDLWHSHNSWWRLYKDPHTKNPRSAQGK